MTSIDDDYVTAAGNGGLVTKLQTQFKETWLSYKLLQLLKTTLNLFLEALHD